MKMSELVTITVSRPVEKEPIQELLDKILKDKPWPEWACGMVCFIYSYKYLWRPLRRSSKGNYYTKTTWKPIFGREVYRLGTKAARIAVYCDNYPYAWCEKVVIVLDNGEIYIGCAFPDDTGKYIFIKIVCKIKLS